jgi:iron complex outermembrane receptor protein
MLTGAVNIVTKDSLDNDASLRLQAGSYASLVLLLPRELV